MAVKCILTGQIPSVLDGVTENVQTQLNNKVNKDGSKVLSTNDYTTAEKTKLSGIETGAQKNTVTSVNGSTGAVTISIPTVNNATIAIQKNGTQVGSFTTNQSSTGTINMTLVKSDVGLGNVDNTSDTNKPISTATQTALDTKQPTITASGILQGDGEGNVTAVEEAEVSLVSLTVDMVEGAASPSRILNITLPTASWTGDGPYTQTVTISNGTANTKVDIIFDVDTYQQMVDDGIGFLAIDNDSGTFTAIAKGSQPSENLSIQVECKEVILS